MNFKHILEKQEIKATVPCRVDLGGTLDISTFFLPLNHLNPATFNIALDMRTKITLSPWRDGYIKISSKGFESAEFQADKAPFNHQMGLMFAVVSFFNGHGVHVQIESSSPPRSALGGSSAAAVAMVAAFMSALGKSESQLTGENGHGHSIDLTNPSQIALIAHYIESSVAGVPCGMQDQLSAAYGGINCWYWKVGNSGVSFTRDDLTKKNDHVLPNKTLSDKLLSNSDIFYDINQNILVAYCGVPHVSSDINGKWVKSFLAGENRQKWSDIVKITHDFSNSVKQGNFNFAASLMNKESRIRIDMTPDVFDKTGKELFACAEKRGCGARFTGAGGGGCLWAIGEKDAIANLKHVWKDILDKDAEAKLLDTKVDFQGVIVS